MPGRPGHVVLLRQDKALVPDLHKYEETIPTIEDPPETAAWIPKPELQQERARHSA
jgi:hypothetical protein